jgi:hypothetical protein
MACVSVLTMDPLADILYAVDPVGVEMITPSPTKVVIGLPSSKISSSIDVGKGPLSITTSFSE